MFKTYKQAGVENKINSRIQHARSCSFNSIEYLQYFNATISTNREVPTLRIRFWDYETHKREKYSKSNFFANCFRRHPIQLWIEFYSCSYETNLEFTDKVLFIRLDQIYIH